MGPPRKLYIDSRFRNAGGSPSDFQVTLAQSIEVPENTVAFVDSVHVPNVFTSVHAKNRNLYLAEYVSSSVTYYKTVQLAEGSYNGVTLATEVQNQLSAGSQNSVTYTVVYQESTGQLTISGTDSFKFLTEEEAKALYGAGGLTAYVPNQTAYAVIGWPEEPMSFGTSHALAGMINVSPHSTLFLCSTDFGGLAGSLGPRGETNIIRRIVIDKPFGSTVHDLHGLMVDYVNCSGHQLNTLSFSLRDSFGNLVDLKGHDFSFSICLVEKTFL